MASDAVRSKALGLLLLIYWLLLLSFCGGGVVLGLCFVLQCFVSFLVLQSYQVVALLMLFFECHIAVIVL